MLGRKRLYEIKLGPDPSKENSIGYGFLAKTLDQDRLRVSPLADAKSQFPVDRKCEKRSARVRGIKAMLNDEGVLLTTARVIKPLGRNYRRVDREVNVLETQEAPVDREGKGQSQELDFTNVAFANESQGIILL
jgi:hypothetical protein